MQVQIHTRVQLYDKGLYRLTGEIEEASVNGVSYKEAFGQDRDTAGYTWTVIHEIENQSVKMNKSKDQLEMLAGQNIIVDMPTANESNHEEVLGSIRQQVSDQLTK